MNKRASKSKSIIIIIRMNYYNFIILLIRRYLRPTLKSFSLLLSFPTIIVLAYLFQNLMMSSVVDRETSLKNLWASSYEVWKNVDELQKTNKNNQEAHFLYLRPCTNSRSNINECMDSSTSGIMEFPGKVLSARGIISIGAWNPLGEISSKEENDKAHEQLEWKIQSMEWPKSCWVRQSFAFSTDWFEPGFIVGCENKEEYYEIVRGQVLDLAKHFRQGAVYEYFPSTTSASVIVRKTVPVLSSGIVEADTFITPCPRPELIDFSDSSIDYGELKIKK